MTGSSPSPKSPIIKRALGGLDEGIDQLGRQTQFYARTLRSLGDALVRFKGETIRLVAPLVAAIGLAATIGAGATAQLGAMWINEEIEPPAPL